MESQLVCPECGRVFYADVNGRDAVRCPNNRCAEEIDLTQLRTRKRKGLELDH